jgi:hypothetical protein
MATFQKAAVLRDGGGGRVDHGCPGSPEEAFMAWLLWLPAGADIAACARVEVARIDGADVEDARRSRLRALFVEAAGRAGRPC